MLFRSVMLPFRNALVDGSFASLMWFSLLGVIIGAWTLVLVAFFSYKKGRFICNAICPVGSTLSVISRHSVFQMEIDTDKCVGCGKCAHHCKSSCINLQDHLIDTSRCVMCLNCLTECEFDALHFTASRKRLSTPLMQEVPTIAKAPSVNMDKRKFISVAGFAIGSAAVGHKLQAVENIDSFLQGSKPIKRKYAVMPPGTKSRNDFYNRCTACMLCVNNCPNRVLKASINEYGICNILQPTMDFDRSFCKVGCTRCTRICPTGALKPLTKEEKLRNPIGLAMVIPENCWGCGDCAASCPYDAIEMIEHKDDYIPRVNPKVCIGCGKCQNVCPANPVKAIWVDGKGK